MRCHNKEEVHELPVDGFKFDAFATDAKCDTWPEDILYSSVRDCYPVAEASGLEFFPCYDRVFKTVETNAPEGPEDWRTLNYLANCVKLVSALEVPDYRTTLKKVTLIQTIKPLSYQNTHFISLNLY